MDLEVGRQPMMKPAANDNGPCPIKLMAEAIYFDAHASKMDEADPRSIAVRDARELALAAWLALKEARFAVVPPAYGS